MTFNWHNQNEEGQESFLAWTVTAAIEDLSRSKFEAMADATDNWSEVDIQMSINGLPLDAEDVLTKTWKRAERLIKQRAAQIVEERVRFVRAEDIVEEALRGARESIKSKFREIGLEFPEEESG